MSSTKNSFTTTSEAPPLLEAHNVLEASIPIKNLRHFAHAIGALSRVGKELYLHGGEEQLVLRTLNDVKSAYLAVHFQSNFFEYFRCESAISVFQEEGVCTSGTKEDAATAVETSSVEGDGRKVRIVSCKVLLRALHNVFRSLKKVQRMIIAIESSEDGYVEPQLILEMQCEYGIVKRHCFLIQDCESVHAQFDYTNASSIHSSPNLLLQHIFNQMKGTAEVVASATAYSFSIRSYHDQNRLQGRVSLKPVLQTEASIPGKDFDAYIFKGDLDGTDEMIFSIKEVRAFLSLCEAVDVENVQISFTYGGNPMQFFGNTNNLSVELMMATNSESPGVESRSTDAEEQMEDTSYDTNLKNGSKSLTAAASSTGTPSYNVDEEDDSIPFQTVGDRVRSALTEVNAISDEQRNPRKDGR